MCNTIEIEQLHKQTNGQSQQEEYHQSFQQQEPSNYAAKGNQQLPTNLCHH
jgi:hypothetical protein